MLSMPRVVVAAVMLSMPRVVVAAVVLPMSCASSSSSWPRWCRCHTHRRRARGGAADAPRRRGRGGAADTTRVVIVAAAVVLPIPRVVVVRGRGGTSRHLR
jgi:hypothetical protein